MMNGLFAVDSFGITRVVDIKYGLIYFLIYSDCFYVQDHDYNRGL